MHFRNFILFSNIRSFELALGIMPPTENLGQSSSLLLPRIAKGDEEAFNGLINAIGSVIKDPMELPEKDITTVDAILFVQNSIKESSALYDQGKYEASWRNYIRRGNEFLTKYSRLTSSSLSNKLRNVILDDQPVAQLAREAWTSRNVFRDLLRELEQKEDRIVDSYLMQLPQKARFGR